MTDAHRIVVPHLGVDIVLPPTWFSYQWAHDPVPGRYWCWDTSMAVETQRELKRQHPEIYRKLVTSYPIEFFLEPLAGNQVDHEYARSLSPERLAEPIIGLCLPEPIRDGGCRVGVIIDGCHRLWRKHELGHTHVDVFQLPDEVEQIIRFPEKTIQALKVLGMLG